MDPDELMEAEVARLRELHEAGAISATELQAGIDEARLTAGLPASTHDTGVAATSRRVSRLPIIIAFVAADLVILAAVLVFLLAD
ncbi:MAG: hypothetical protein ACR2N6_06520 [Miltoncostaeaceae bacterium]